VLRRAVRAERWVNQTQVRRNEKTLSGRLLAELIENEPSVLESPSVRRFVELLLLSRAFGWGNPKGHLKYVAKAIGGKKPGRPSSLRARTKDAMMFRLTKKIKQSFEMALRFVPDHLKKEHDILRHLDNEGLEGAWGRSCIHVFLLEIH